MAESVLQWWQRRQWSKDAAVPYPPGTYAADWAQFRRVGDFYRPDRNHGIVLSQVPLAADVWLVFRCPIGHEWTATPAEQRERTGRRGGRDRSCPVCAAPRDRMLHPEQKVLLGPEGLVGEPSALAMAAPAHRGTTGRAVVEARRAEQRVSRRAEAQVRRALTPTRPGALTTEERRALADGRSPGEAWHDPALHLATSAAEGALKRLLAERLRWDEALNSVRVAQPFHKRLDVWPDVVLGDLRVAIEYDTTGRLGDEHTGHRMTSDKRKDALLRRVGWEVVRLRGPGLPALGAFDLDHDGRVTAGLVDALVERLAAIRGELFVAAYRR